jgi:hypothetical protein
MPVATIKILFRWFPLILDEFLHEISYIRKVISLYFYACIKHLKRSSDATWTSVSALMLTCYSSNEHWWRQKCPLLLFWDVNDARGYYHCSDGPNFTYGYYRNHAVCSFVVVDLSLIYRYTPNLNLCTIHISWALVWLHRSVHHQAGGVSAFENVWFQQWVSQFGPPGTEPTLKGLSYLRIRLVSV